MTTGNPTQSARDTLIAAAENRQMFDAIARRYDLLNRLLSLGQDTRWRRRLVCELAPRAGAVYLDIGTGTADLPVEVCRQAPGAQVVGIDVAAQMLGLGAGKIQSRGVGTSCHLCAADACLLPFSPGAFSGAVSAFCLRNIERRAQAFRELSRVLRPGSRAVFLELTRPSGRLLRAGHRAYNRSIAPLLGWLLSHGDAYRYLIDSIEHFPDVDGVLREMRSNGFCDVRGTGLSGGIVTVFVGVSG